MTNELTAAPVRSMIATKVDVEAYQKTVLFEARQRVATREAGLQLLETEVAEAERGLEAAIYADIPTQIQLYRNLISRRRNVRTRRTHQLENSRKFLSLVEEGYLPIPFLQETSDIHWLRDPLPPDVLNVIGHEEAHGRFQEIRVVGIPHQWEDKRRRHRDPILVGICDGEMFPLAWWR